MKNHDEEEHTHYHGVDKAGEHISVSEALKILLNSMNERRLRDEVVDFQRSLKRVLSKDLVSVRDIPTLSRSTRDGYAIRAGNSTNEFRIVGSVAMGVFPRDLSIGQGEAARIATGAYLPRGANAVVMKEYADERIGSVTFEKNRTIKPWQNVLRSGEDIKRGETVLRAGTRIEAPHIALAALVGARTIRVFQRPRVAFFSTGDELVDLRRTTKRIEKIVDINRPFISSMLQSMGAEPLDLGIARDDLKVIKSKMINALQRGDALLLSAGSSVGERDFVSSAAASISGLKILVHGVAMRPSSPTGIATYHGKPVIFLPGFPTSAIVSFLVFAKAAISKLSGASESSLSISAALNEDDLHRTRGVTQFLRVKVVRRSKEYFARVVHPSEAYFSRWLGEANGIAVVDESTRIGGKVEVFPIADITESDS